MQPKHEVAPVEFKETLKEVRGLRGEVAEINRSQADLKTDQAAMLRDIHHMNLQMVDQAKSIKEMAQAVVKLAAVSEKMDRANKDINNIGEEMREDAKNLSDFKEEMHSELTTLKSEQATLKEQQSSSKRSINWIQWIIGTGLIGALGTLIKKLLEL